MANLKIRLFNKNQDTLYPQTVIENVAGLTAALGAKSELAGNNTFSGANTFEGAVNVKAPTEDAHASTKKYVDDEITSVEGQVALKADANMLAGTGQTGFTSSNTVRGAITALGERIDGIIETGVSYEVVTVLPAVEDAEKGIIYLVPDATNTEGNVYKEYMLFETEGVAAFQLIGTTATDLSTKADVTALQKAIEDAASDATTKANAAQAAAIAAAASDAAEQIKAVTDQLGELGAVVYYAVVSE